MVGWKLDGILTTGEEDVRVVIGGTIRVVYKVFEYGDRELDKSV